MTDLFPKVRRLLVGLQYYTVSLCHLTFDLTNNEIIKSHSPTEVLLFKNAQELSEDRDYDGQPSQFPVFAQNNSGLVRLNGALASVRGTWI